MENQNTQQQTEAMQNPPQSEPQNDLRQLIDEAEQRGYLRGCNEAAEKLIARPALFQEQHPKSEPLRQSPLLTPRRVSIWDMP